MSKDEFEEQWRRLLNKADVARAAYQAAIMDDSRRKKAAAEMYAANANVRNFCAAERQMKAATTK